jgi:hypothetical protein
MLGPCDTIPSDTLASLKMDDMENRACEPQSEEVWMRDLELVCGRFLLLSFLAELQEWADHWMTVNTDSYIHVCRARMDVTSF